MKPYKVLVVDDSAFMRKLVSDFIAEDNRFQIIATARDGMDAIQKARELKPDVITMDVEMPKLNGLEALRAIMSENPIPVIMLSSLTSEGANETIQALEWGAVDFVQKPSGSISLDLHKIKAELQLKINTAVQAKVRKTVHPPMPGASLTRTQSTAVQSEPTKALQPTTRPTTFQKKSTHKALHGSPVFDHIVAIGTSTGGPKALQEVIPKLPADYPAPIVIVQHMPPLFTRSLANRLDAMSEIRVKEAQEGDQLKAGTAYIAPGGFQMAVARDPMYRIRITEDPPQRGHRPSADYLFESLLPYTELKRHVVLMTGMGNDGAAGMNALKEAGALTSIAESEQTCIVYGMPRSAVELGCVDHILPLDAIAAQLLKAIK